MYQLSADEDREISDEVINNPIKMHRPTYTHGYLIILKKQKRATHEPFQININLNYKPNFAFHVFNRPTVSKSFG